jgi:hypothetical protein
VCPKCEGDLTKEIRKDSEEHMCRTCNLGVLGCCECTTTYYDVLYVICNTCNILEQQTNILEQQKSKQTQIEKIRNMKIAQNKQFSNKWKTSTPIEKLQCYTQIQKLKYLCKQKGLKGFSNKDRQTLIDMLKDHVIDSDFPIKD